MEMVTKFIFPMSYSDYNALDIYRMTLILALIIWCEKQEQ